MRKSCSLRNLSVKLLLTCTLALSAGCGETAGENKNISGNTGGEANQKQKVEDAKAEREKAAKRMQAK
jgi:hypothetical protein